MKPETSQQKSLLLKTKTLEMNRINKLKNVERNIKIRGYA